MNKKVKSVVFLSNFYNHHQSFLCKEFYNIYGDGFKFIETTCVPDERIKMGWGEKDIPSFVLTYDYFQRNYDLCKEVIDNSDVVIFGSAPYLLLKNRIKNKKVIFKYCERPLKINNQKWKYIFRLVTWRIKNPQYDKFNLLCASGYTSADYNKFLLYINKCFKWGYFPQFKKYNDVQKIIKTKNKNSILWCGRLIDLKHPDMVIEVAKLLKNEGYDFRIIMIGNGVLENKIQSLIKQYNLSGYVSLIGALPYDKIRDYMEKSEIFLFTSDRNEGWGAVLNESMNSACAVVASHSIGSVPFLINNGKNGFVYKDGCINELFEKTKWLLDHSNERKLMSSAAYYTIENEWNPQKAAMRFSIIAELIFNNKKSNHVFSNGVCSKALPIKDNLYNNNV